MPVVADIKVAYLIPLKSDANAVYSEAKKKESIAWTFEKRRHHEKQGKDWYYNARHNLGSLQ